MTPGRLDLKVIGDRLSASRRMLAQLRSLPQEDLAAFTADFRTAAAAESLLRRTIESLLDVARHILAKRHGIGTLEYREVARAAGDRGLIADTDLRHRFIQIAGFRNRLTHFYEEVSPQELHAILQANLADLDRLAAELEATAARLIRE
jgi:uncharacterized protein YutE (UPF0331/DUF86 family)